VYTVYCAVTPQEYCEAAGFTYVTPLAGVMSEGCYSVNTDNTNWLDAAVHCNSLHDNGHLVVILSSEDQQSVISYFSSVDGAYVLLCVRLDATVCVTVTAVY